MRRQLISLIGVLIFSSSSANELSEKLHQQLGQQGYYYGPNEPQAGLELKRNSEGRYLVCLSPDQKKSFIYEVTKTFFPDGTVRIIIWCNQGELVISKSWWKKPE